MRWCSSHALRRSQSQGALGIISLKRGSRAAGLQGCGGGPDMQNDFCSSLDAGNLKALGRKETCQQQLQAATLSGVGGEVESSTKPIHRTSPNRIDIQSNPFESLQRMPCDAKGRPRSRCRCRALVGPAAAHPPERTFVVGPVGFTGTLMRVGITCTKATTRPIFMPFPPDALRIFLRISECSPSQSSLDGFDSHTRTSRHGRFRPELDGLGHCA